MELIGSRLECYEYILEMLEMQSAPEDVDSLSQSPILLEIVKSDDEFFHYLFYEKLRYRQLLVIILKVRHPRSLVYYPFTSQIDTSPYLEQYLIKHQLESHECGTFLSSVYRNRGRYSDAVNKLYELASSEKYVAIH